MQNITKHLLVVAVAIVLQACNTQQQPFVSSQGGQLFCNGEPYYFVGTNFWYAPILASVGEGGSRERLHTELDSLQSRGIRNLRILVGADGERGVESRISPTLQPQAGVYNDTLLDGLDYLMAQLGQRQMHAVLYLNNSWEWSGGYSVYLQWSGHGQAPIPSIDGWPTYMDYVAEFVRCATAQQLFAQHVDFILKRKNRYTGLAYTQDPAIMAWQVGNEPRCFSQSAEDKQLFAEWLRRTTAQIRKQDPNHLISIGSEGIWGCEQDSALYAYICSDPNVDYLNAHIWPYNWGWAHPDSLSEHLPLAIQNSERYINQHLDIAQRLSKPLVIEEFGYPRDDMQLLPNTPTTARKEYYRFIFDKVHESQQQGSLLAGCNFWAWGGTAVPHSSVWRIGDPYTGDPAQEPQGLNSVFASDVLY